VITASIILNRLFQGLEASLSAPEFLLIFLASVLAGILLVDPETIILGYVGLLALSIAIVYVGFTLPVLVGSIQSAVLAQSLMEGTIGIIARIVFFYLLIPCLMGGILGGIIGERLRIG
jgi:hypothetical protein